MHRKLKVLLIVEQCNPEWASVPLEGFRYYTALNRLADVTLVTHERNAERPGSRRSRGRNHRHSRNPRRAVL
jgi:hypothetical protein